MNLNQKISVILVVVAGGFLAFRATTGEFGKVYSKTTPVEFSEKVKKKVGDSVTPWTKETVVDRRETRDESGALKPDVHVNLSLTIGLWVAAFGTLCMMSFLIGDNFLYKFVESVVIGTSAAYAMVTGFWTGIVQNLFGKLTPDLVRSTVLPGVPEEQAADLLYIIPLGLSVLMLWRLAPVGTWVSRWPLAFFIGATAGIRLIAYLESDFVLQIGSTIIPVVVLAADGSFDWLASLKNVTIIVSVLVCLVYFFFSFEHRGAVGAAARVGIWVLMITFGAGFGMTVMGRIALISDRLSFLFYDWLWLPKPGIDS